MEEPEALQHALDWFLEALDSEEWRRRRSAIEDHIESVIRIHPSGEIAPPPSSISVRSDQIGWYLYLIEAYLTDITKYEPTAGARILPTFVRLGSHIELLNQIGGVKVKRDSLLREPNGHPDLGLFELLVALLWKRNGWPDVQLVPETSDGKRPDIHVQSKTTEWAVECKRLSQSSEYSIAERRKWLTMWRALRELLVSRGWAYVLEIVFHVPLETLPDDFLRRELAGKLPLIVPPCTIISNETCEVGVYPVNMEAARRHLEKNFVKVPSDQLNELVAGYRDPNRGFTCVFGGKTGRIGGVRGNNRYLDQLHFAAGAFWHCDAESVIQRKARDIRARLSEAVRQLPADVPSVVHIGLETLDGILVEAERYQRILNTVFHFDPRAKDLRWVYCHLYQSYAPPDQSWVFDETVYYFSHANHVDGEPLRNRATIIPEEHGGGLGVHWLRDTP